MSWQAPNLAHAPFENLRPVRRLSALAAGAAAVLTAWNVATWVRSGAGAAEKTAEVERLRSETARATERVATLEQDLGAADLEAVNAQVQFLNSWIDRRAFSWNRVIDHLVEALPPGVRISSLTPQSGDRSRGAALPAPDAAAAAVQLRIDGEAEDDEAVLELVDRLFAHPLFGRPDLARETRQGTAGAVGFDLTVAYHPPAVPLGTAAVEPAKPQPVAPEIPASAAAPPATATPEATP